MRSLSEDNTPFAGNYDVQYDWDRVFRDPKSVKLSDLRWIARDLGVRVSGSKAVVCANVLAPFEQRGTKRNREEEGEKEGEKKGEKEGEKEGEKVGAEFRRSILPPTLLRVLHIEQSSMRLLPSNKVIDMYNLVAHHKHLSFVYVMNRDATASKLRSVMHASFASSAELARVYEECRGKDCFDPFHVKYIKYVKYVKRGRWK